MPIMKNVFFGILTLLVMACAGSKQAALQPSQQLLREQTLREIDKALTPPVYARDVKHAFELTIAYADSLHNAPAKHPVMEVVWSDTAFLLAFAILILGFYLILYRKHGLGFTISCILLNCGILLIGYSIHDKPETETVKTVVKAPEIPIKPGQIWGLGHPADPFCEPCHCRVIEVKNGYVLTEALIRFGTNPPPQISYSIRKFRGEHSLLTDVK